MAAKESQERQRERLRREYDHRRHLTAHSAPHATVSPRGVLLYAPADCRYPLEGRTSYDPYKRFSLPNALARVTDERSAIRFAKAYGLLGYADVLTDHWQQLTIVDRRRLFDDPLLNEERLAQMLRDLGDEHGDPMPWLLAQARSVRLAMELIEALGRGDEDAMHEAILRHAIPHDDAPDGRPRLLAAGGLTTKWLDPGIPLMSDDPDVGRWRSAAHLIEDLVNPNLAGLRWEIRTLDYRTQPEIEPGFVHRALFEVIWWHVGNAAFGRRQGTRVKLCELAICRAPFIVTDERQRFCPADYIYEDKNGHKRPGRSRCAALYQKRQGKKAGSS